MRLEDYMGHVNINQDFGMHIVGFLVENEMTREADGEYWVLIQEGHFSELRERSAEGWKLYDKVVSSTEVENDKQYTADGTTVKERVVKVIQARPDMRVEVRPAIVSSDGWDVVAVAADEERAHVVAKGMNDGRIPLD